MFYLEFLIISVISDLILPSSVYLNSFGNSLKSLAFRSPDGSKIIIQLFGEDIQNNFDLEIPFGTTTESLIDSILKANDNGKINEKTKRTTIRCKCIMKIGCFVRMNSFESEIERKIRK